MADQFQVEMLLRSVKEWNTWRSMVKKDMVFPDLHRANLQGAILKDANLGHADLYRADLSGTFLVNANFYEATLSGADLENADLRDAHLYRADLVGTDLRGAELSGAEFFWANLRRTNFSGAYLRGAKLLSATLDKTVLASVNLEPLVSTDLQHKGPSFVDWRSIAMSLKVPNLHQFLVDIGMPEVIATYMIDCCKSIDPEEMFTMMQSTFISYGGPDEKFARKLQEALRRNGVQTWFFPEDAEPGQKLHRVMARGIENHDRVIVICSKSSLGRKGVSNEIEQSLEKEAELGGEELIIPVRIDNYLFDDWKPANPEHGKALRRRVVGDFRDEADFDSSLGKLLKALKLKDDS